MAKNDSPVKPEDVKAVGIRCEQSFHAITALHDLCVESMGEVSPDIALTFTILQLGLRSLARDMEVCAEILQNDRVGLGFFKSHYGSV